MYTKSLSMFYGGRYPKFLSDILYIAQCSKMEVENSIFSLNLKLQDQILIFAMSPNFSSTCSMKEVAQSAQCNKQKV